MASIRGMGRKSLAVLLACLLTPAGKACCITYADVAMHLAMETAIIFWDEERKIEHFIRRAEFKGHAKDFGFIFPSPTQPFRIAVADEDVFAELEHLKPPPRSFGCMRAQTEAAGADNIEILEEKIVGDFKATVFRAKDGSAITKWLTGQGHKLRPTMTPWFDHYATKDWVFTALKYLGRQGKTPTRALCISFEAQEPFYPFKMPSDTFDPKTYRPIDLYFLSQRQVDATLTGGAGWKGEKIWTRKLTSHDRASLETATLADRSRLEIPAELTLTRFRNTPAADVFEEDIVFRPSRSYTGWWVALAAVALVLLIWRGVRHRRSSSAATAPEA